MNEKRLNLLDKSKLFVKILLISFSIIILLLCLLTCFNLLLYSDLKESSIRCSNYDAEVVAFYVSNAISDLDMQDEISYTLSGEYSYDHCLIYASDIIKEDMILYEISGNAHCKFWTAKASGTRVEEVWISDTRLSVSDLHKYTVEEQESSIHFVTCFTPKKYFSMGPVDDSELIGYYKNK